MLDNFHNSLLNEKKEICISHLSTVNNWLTNSLCFENTFITDKGLPLMSHSDKLEHKNVNKKYLQRSQEILHQYYIITFCNIYTSIFYNQIASNKPFFNKLVPVVLFNFTLEGLKIRYKSQSPQ